MKTQVMEAPKRSQLYWLSKNEAEDETFMAFLKSMIANRKEPEMRPVIIESGKGDPEEMIYLLLKRNIDHPHTELSKAS